MADDGIKFCGDGRDNWLSEWQPSRAECMCAAMLWNDSKRMRILTNRYVRTIMDLMLSGFCVLLMCSPAIAQQFVVTERVEFVVTDRVAAEAIKPPAQSGRYLVKFSIDNCGPCVNWNANERSAIASAGFMVVDVNMSDPDMSAKYSDPARQQRQVTRFPSFAICNWEDGGWVGDKIVGYATAETLLKKLNDQQAEATKPIVALPVVPAPAQKQEYVSIYSGKPGSSHQNRASLIDHLLNEGIHSGRHTSQQLNAMTDSELNYLHESDHGWGHSQPQSVVRVQQSGCVGGNCPAPTNRAQRRRGFLGGLFR